MTALELLRPYTSQSAQHRGADYASRVRLSLSDRHHVEAVVRGTLVYDVALRFDAGKLRVRCTCPFFEDRAVACKHVWATALVAGQRGLLDDLPDDTPVTVDVEDLEDHTLEPPDPADVPRIAGERRFPGDRRDPFIYAPPYRSAPRRPAWEAALGAVMPAAIGPLRAAWSDVQLLYVITAPPVATTTEVSMHVERRTRKRDGAWTKPQAAALTLDAIEQLPDDDDRWALSLMHGVSGYPRAYGSYGYGMTSQPFGAVFLKAALIDLLLPRLCATGRVRLRQQSTPTQPRAGKDEDIELTWDDAAAWTLEINVENSGAGYRVDAVLTRGSDRENISRFALLTDSIAILDGRVAPFDPAGGFAWAAQLRSRGPFEVPGTARGTLRDALVRSNLAHLRVPDDLRWDERRVTPTFVATIDAPNTYTETCAIHAAGDYDGTRTPLEQSGAALSDDGRIVYPRDREAEQQALAALKRHGALGIDQFPARTPTIHTRKLATLVQGLVQEGWRVEAEGVRYRAIAAPRLRVKSGIDWFDIEAVSDNDAPLDIPDLLKAVASNRRTVTLDDGTIGVLPQEWLARVAPALMLGQATVDGVRFKPSQTALVDALLAEQPAVEWDAGFIRAREALQRFEGVRAEDPPATFRGELREYQRESLGWMRFLREFGFGGCLADDMGLGKTVMVLAMLDARRTDTTRPQRPSLIVLPRSLLFNWMSEAARFTPELRVLDFAGAARHGVADAIAHADVVLTTYGTLRRDVPLLDDQHFDYVILDEAQAIKNAATVTAKAVRLLRANHRLALTGTPVENHLGELHSLFDFLNPGLLGRGAVLDLRRQSLNHREHIEKLARGLRPFFLRRTKEQVAPELPPRTEETLYCELDREQRAQYDELREHYRRVLLKKIDRDGIAKSQAQILEALLRLRQAACHPRLLKKTATASSAKFDLLLPRLAELIDEGRKALVFSQFTSLLALLRDHLDAGGITYEYLDGQTPDRAAHVQRFQQDPSCPLFLISLRAGGVGLNLTAAEYVFLLDPWWNPAVEMQAIDRTHRIGQTKPVFAYRLVSRHTVEERILELQARKRELADAILEAGAGGLRGLQREDLEALLA